VISSEAFETDGIRGANAVEMGFEIPLGEILIEEGFISPEELSEILGTRADTTEALGDLLVRLGKISEKQKLFCEGRQRGIEYIDLSEFAIDTSVATLLPHAAALRLKALPVAREGDTTLVAMVNPIDINAIDEVTKAVSGEIRPMIASEEDVKEAIFRAFGAYDDMSDLIGEAVKNLDVPDIELADEESKADSQPSISELKEIAEGAPVVRLVNGIITKAISSRASDIHIEPLQSKMRVRYRVDGMLQEAMTIPKDLQNSVVSRVKVMASMDIAERRAPQDGRITLTAQFGEYDLRISSYPCVHGENLVLRILDKRSARVSLDKLGMPDNVREAFERMIAAPYGMILSAGPTGAGKTTTLYAALNALNSVERHIITIEDPVEYQLPGVVQGNVNRKAGVTFPSGLRSIVRQDPDVILVGEIRDGETAQIAVEAALTGHLVLSTIHANNAGGAISRLSDMGIEPFLTASSLLGVCSQRLVRLICDRCASPYDPPPGYLERAGLADAFDEGFEFRKGNGCEHCTRTGYHGRTAVYEILVSEPRVQQMILARASADEIRAVAVQAGMTTMRDDGIRKVQQHLTTIEELVRATHTT
jgi:type IV pilus assembly protein PilB